MIENWAALPNKQTWEIGENIMADGYPCLRSLQNPRTGGDPLLSNTGGYPDSYHGQFWDNASSPDPHINSTVLSHWFYLLSIGGNGWNNGQTSQAPTGSGYQWNVNGIGITEAASIVWEAESDHLIQSSTNYAAVRTDMISAAQNLYGVGSCEEIAVTNAWYAVGVGAAYSGNAGLSISGDASFCTTSNPYTIPKLPTGATVTWSWFASPYGSVQINSPNANSTTLTKLMDGTITLTATINNVCGTNQIVITKQITVGNPLYGTINQGGILTPMNTANSVSAGATLVNFQWPNVTGISCYQSSTNPPISQTGFIYYPSTSQFWFTLSSGQSITVSFSGTGCGSSVIATRSFNVGGHYYVISPNPASGTVTISPNTNSSMSKTAIGSTGIIQVSITDVNGILKKQQKFNASTANMQLNVADLIPGTYFVQIINGDIHDTQQLIINR